MVIPAKQRWILGVLALALTVPAVKLAVGQEPAPPEAARNPAGRAAREAPAAAPRTDPVPGVRLDRLAPRPAQAPAADPFQARSWAGMAEGELRRSAPPPPPAPPQAPPLPFAFMGRLIDGGAVTVFLTRADRNYVVRAGDTLDGAYAVAAIEDDRVVLTYLPLGLKQTLAFPASTAPQAPGSRQRRARDDEDDE